MRRLLRAGLVLALLLALVAGGLGAVRANSFSRAISGKGVLESDMAELADRGDRFNLLVLGYGGGTHDGADLTDSILVYSVPLDGGEASQVSVPRDLWIESPAGTGYYRKVNAAYAAAVADGASPRKAAALASKSIGAALGVPIHGWLTVDFDGFRDLVDALGGVDVEVQRSFTARYPRSDDPAKDARWKMVRFRKGQQHMDGQRAIAYARARYADGPEGSDFARAARQQRLVSAIKSRLFSPAGLLRGFAVTGAVEDDVRTNLSAGDLARVFRQRVDARNSVVLSEENVLASGVSDDGQYILLPRNNDPAALRRFVRSSLSGAATARK